MVLTPDELQAALYNDDLKPNMRQGTALAFAHGLNIHFKLIEPRPDMDVFMIAPKGPGHTVRSEYLRGGGVPCLVAVDQNPSRQRARDRALLRLGDRRRPRRRHRDHLQGGMRDRSLRRADACCAAASRRSSWPATRRWSRPATRPRWPISSACTR